MHIRDILQKKEPKPIQSSDFKASVKEIIKSKDGGSVHIYRVDPDGGSGLVGNFVSKGDVRDFDDVDIEPYMKSRYGGGTFNVILMKMDKDDKVERAYSNFRFHIDGDPLESRHETSMKSKTYQESAFNFAEKALDKLVESLGKDGKNDAVLAIMQANQASVQSLFAQIVEIQNKNTETILRLMEKSKNGDNPVYEALDGILKLNEVKEMLAPNVSSDKTLEWVRTLGNIPFVTNLAGKMLGLNLPSQASQELPMELSRPPGDQPAVQHNSSSVPPSTQQQADQPGDSVPGQNRGAFEIVMLDPIINLIDNKASPIDIASAIYQAISWTLTSMKAGVHPHPIMANFTKAIVEIMGGKLELEDLEKAYNEFAREIEIPAELIEPVKSELIKIYTPIFMQLKGATNA